MVGKTEKIIGNGMIKEDKDRAGKEKWKAKWKEK